MHIQNFPYFLSGEAISPLEMSFILKVNGLNDIIIIIICATLSNITLYVDYFTLKFHAM